MINKLWSRWRERRAPAPTPTLYADIYQRAMGLREDDPKALIGDQSGQPYVVRFTEEGAFGGGWIPLNVMIYAASEADAKRRVIEAVKDSYEQAMAKYKDDTQFSTVHHHYQYNLNNIERARKLLNIAAGIATRKEDKAYIQVERVDTRRMIQVGWDTRKIF